MLRMALQANITTTVRLVGEITVASYVRVSRISGNAGRLDLLVEAFKNNKDGELVDTRSMSFVPVLEGDNFIRQAYLHLKTLPEFAGATDC